MQQTVSIRSEARLLDQTRVGSIIIRDGSCLVSLVRTMRLRNYNTLFSGNMTHAKLVNLHLLPDLSRELANRLYGYFSFDNVKSLDISYNIKHPERKIARQVMYALRFLFPNVEQLDMSYIADTSCAFVTLLPSLSRLVWNGTAIINQLDGSQMPRQLVELSIDGCHVIPSARSYPPTVPLDFMSHNDQMERLPNNWRYLFMNCHRLERLSIKGATYQYGEEKVRSLPQRLLIQLVLHHPTLRWLRSDLTASNIRKLKESRPDITFVSD